MADNAPITGAANAATFDVAAWLSHFESMGGSYLATESQTSFCLTCESMGSRRKSPALALLNSLTDDQRAEVVAHIRAMAGLSPALKESTSQPDLNAIPLEKLSELAGNAAPSSGASPDHQSEGSQNMDMTHAFAAALSGQRPKDWDNALAEYQALRAWSDSLPLDDPQGDMAVDACCAAMDHLVENTSSPNHQALIYKMEFARERWEGFPLPEKWLDAFLADLRGLDQSKTTSFSVSAQSLEFEMAAQAWVKARDAVEAHRGDDDGDSDIPDDLCDAETTAWKAMLNTPAPDLAALRFKLTRLLNIEPAVDAIEGWSGDEVRQTLADIERLLVDTCTDAKSAELMVSETDALKESAEGFNTLEHRGPDLSQARPIEDLIANLASLHDGYPTAFLSACDNAGITVSVSRNAEGEDGLILGCPYDGQGDLRRKYHDAFCALFRSRPEHRQAIIDLVNASGVFVDEQPYSSARELIRDFCAAGGWFAVNADGRLEHPLPCSEEAWAAENARGYPLRRLAQRLEVTLRKQAVRDELAALIRAYGNLHDGSDWHVLKAPEAARLVDGHTTGTPFNAAEWLARFKANGGECWIAEGKAYIGARLDGNEEAEIRAADMMREYLANKEIADAVRCHLLMGQDEHTPDPASVFSLSTSPKRNV